MGAILYKIGSFYYDAWVEEQIPMPRRIKKIRTGKRTHPPDCFGSKKKQEPPLFADQRAKYEPLGLSKKKDPQTWNPIEDGCKDF